MTEEDSKVMNLLHNKGEDQSFPYCLDCGREISEKPCKGCKEDKYKNDPRHMDLDREMEEREEQRKKAEAVKEIFATSDPDEVITTTFTDEELQEHVKDKIEEELRNITPKQLFNLAIVVLGGDNTLILEFTKMSRANNYEVLEIPKGNKYFSTLYRPAKSTSEFVMLKLPPKQN